MKILIKSLLKGAKQAKGSVVIIDVFRATSCITTLLAGKVNQITPALTPKEARLLKKDKKDIIVGERIGKQLKDFDYNISPVELSKLDLAHKNIILTTTNGTRGILSAKQADEIIMGSFLNATAVSEYLKSKKTVTLVPIGYMYGRFKAIEDEQCARLIRDCILNKDPDFSKIRKRIKNNLSTIIRNRLQNQDIDFCLTLDKYKVIPQFVDGKIISR